MDSVTQVVLGAAVGEAVLGRKIGNKAILWGGIAGTIPDLDVICRYIYDPLTANELHRGFTHSILFSVLVAPIFGWLLAKWYKKEDASAKDWTKLMFWGLFTHPILDAFTTWGTQLFWPHPIKISFKNIFVVDPLYTVPFIVCLVLAMRLPKTHPKRAKFNRLGIWISTSYLAFTLILKANAHFTFKEQLESQNISYESIQTKPTPFNTILWTANVKTKDAFLIGYTSLLDKEHRMEFISFPKQHQQLGELIHDEKIKRIDALTEGWFTVEAKADCFVINDLRFGQVGISNPNGRFVFAYKFWMEEDRSIVDLMPRPTEEVKASFKELLERVKGI